jgi:hypothetical protein
LWVRWGIRTLLGCGAVPSWEVENMHARRATLVAATSLVVLMITAAQALAAPSPVRFSGAQYDSPGKDGGSNASLNAEWVRITNHGNRARTLTGWTIRDRAGHVYKFGQEQLGSGKSVRIHTGKGQDTRRDKYMDRGWYVWNNTGDTATLKNKGGQVVDRCRWGDGPGFTRC